MYNLRRVHPLRAMIMVLALVALYVAATPSDDHAYGAAARAFGTTASSRTLAVHPADLELVDVWWLENWATEYCLAIPNSSKTQGTAAIQWPCETNDDQKWDIYRDFAFTSAFEIVNAHSHLCLAVPGGKATPGLHLIQWPCNNGLEQRWIIADSYYEGDNPCLQTFGCQIFVNYESGLCMAIPHGDKNAGLNAIQWGCEDTNEQFWTPLVNLINV